VLDELQNYQRTGEFYLTIYQDMAEKVASLQQADGLWRRSCFLSGARGRSGSRATTVMLWHVGHK